MSRDSESGGARRNDPELASRRSHHAPGLASGPPVKNGRPRRKSRHGCPPAPGGAPPARCPRVQPRGHCAGPRSQCRKPALLRPTTSMLSGPPCRSSSRAEPGPPETVTESCSRVVSPLATAAAIRPMALPVLGPPQKPPAPFPRRPALGPSPHTPRLRDARPARFQFLPTQCESPGP